MRSPAIQRFLNPNRNVGGGDLVLRVAAIGVLAALTFFVLPQANVSPPLLKISMLCVTEAGLLGVMLGMFLRSKTYFAGFQLALSSLLMLWLVRQHLPYVAAMVGLGFIAGGVTEIATRRSRINALLGVNSVPQTSTKELIEEALLPDSTERGATK